jgi:hypothetical protein
MPIKKSCFYTIKQKSIIDQIFTLLLQADFWRITDDREAGTEDDYGRPLGKVGGHDDKGTLSRDFLF